MGAATTELMCPNYEVAAPESPCSTEREATAPQPKARAPQLQRQVWLSLFWGPWVLVHIRFCLSSPSVSGNVSHSIVSSSATPWTVARQAGVGCHVLLQGIFPTQGLNPGLLHCGWILYQLSYRESPRILEWVAFPFSRGSS